MKRIKKLFDIAPHITFVLTNVFVAVFIYVLGASFNSNKLDAKFMAMTNFGKNADYVHLTIDSEEKGYMEYKVSDGICYDYYNRRNRIKGYTKMMEPSSIVFKNHEYDVSFCGSPVYNDFDVSEYLRFPMYLADSAIKKGPKYGATYATYISSYTADQMLEEMGLSSYDELLAYEECYQFKVKNLSYSMSINNIYLCSETTHWNKDINSYEDTYFKQFGLLNQDAVFAYAENVHNAVKKSSLCIDMKADYSHFSTLIKDCLKKNEASIRVVIEKGKENYTLTFSNDEYTNVFTDKTQIACYIAIPLMLAINAILIVAFKELRKDLFKVVLCLAGLYVLFAVLIEILIGIMPMNIALMSFFGTITNAAIILYLLLLSIISLLVYNDDSPKELERNVKKDGE